MNNGNNQEEEKKNIIGNNQQKQKKKSKVSQEIKNFAKQELIKKLSSCLNGENNPFQQSEAAFDASHVAFQQQQAQRVQQQPQQPMIVPVYVEYNKLYYIRKIK